MWFKSDIVRKEYLVSGIKGLKDSNMETYFHHTVFWGPEFFEKEFEAVQYHLLIYNAIDMFTLVLISRVFFFSRLFAGLSINNVDFVVSKGKLIKARFKRRTNLGRPKQLRSAVHSNVEPN